MLKKTLTSLSFILVAFGQPAFFWQLGPIAACCGFALFWFTLMDISDSKSRFYRGAIWFFCVQLVQLCWFLSHPYAYIYPVYFLLCLALGVQFGFLCRFVTLENLSSFKGIAGITAFWVIMEWMRLHVLSGFSWNPVGLYLSTTLYGMQLSSFFGVYGLSFLVIFTNLLALKMLISPSTIKIGFFFIALFFPYLYGCVHYHYHHRFYKSQETIQVVLVQTAFPVEESMGIKNLAEFVKYVIEEWDKILLITKKNLRNPIDLIVLPEFVVPLGTYTFIYPYKEVKKKFEEQYGTENLKHLPQLQLPFAKEIETNQGKEFFVNNAFWAQAIANTFDAPILLGLEDVDDKKKGEPEYYSAALMIYPNKELASSWPYSSERYEKRVLVPMGEYIPFEFFREIARSYGVNGSFTSGNSAKVLDSENLSVGVSICYEETFGHLIRENRQKGAKLHVNLTSDVWYPDSTLTRQHLEHARLRTVEAGIPLIRSCNTGITCAIDSLGRTIASLDEYDAEGNWLADSLLVSIPKYHYFTPYTQTGDFPIIGISLLSLAYFFIPVRRNLLCPVLGQR